MERSTCRHCNRNIYRDILLDPNTLWSSSRLFYDVFCLENERRCHEAIVFEETPVLFDPNAIQQTVDSYQVRVHKEHRLLELKKTAEALSRQIKLLEEELSYDRTVSVEDRQRAICDAHTLALVFEDNKRTNN